MLVCASVAASSHRLRPTPCACASFSHKRTWCGRGTAERVNLCTAASACHLRRSFLSTVHGLRYLCAFNRTSYDLPRWYRPNQKSWQEKPSLQGEGVCRLTPSNYWTAAGQLAKSFALQVSMALPAVGGDRICYKEGLGLFEVNTRCPLNCNRVNRSQEPQLPWLMHFCVGLERFGPSTFCSRTFLLQHSRLRGAQSALSSKLEQSPLW